MATELHDLSIAELARLIAARKLSPVDLCEALIRRVEQHDGQTRAFITRTFDLAREQARRAEEQRRARDAAAKAQRAREERLAAAKDTSASAPAAEAPTGDEGGESGEAVTGSTDDAGEKASSDG